MIICRCEEIDEEEVLYAIRSLGARTVDDVKRYTNACAGLCQGKTCGRIIARLLAKEMNSPLPHPQKARPPVRPIKIGEFFNNNEKENV